MSPPSGPWARLRPNSRMTYLYKNTLKQWAHHLDLGHVWDQILEASCYCQQLCGIWTKLVWVTNALLKSNCWILNTILRLLRNRGSLNLGVGYFLRRGMGFEKRELSKVILLKEMTNHEHGIIYWLRFYLSELWNNIARQQELKKNNSTKYLELVRQAFS